MKSTPIGDNIPPAEARPPSETAPRWDLPDAMAVEESDEQVGRYRVKYDPVRATASYAVVTAVSNVVGIGPLELDPLYECIDGDELNALCTEHSSTIRQLTFQYSGCEITVRTDDVVEVVRG